MATHRAIIVENFGHAPRVSECAVPAPGPGQVRVRVAACGLNFADLLMLTGDYQATPPLPFIPGMEIAGRVEALGSGVTGLAPGDRIAAVPGHGGLAEMAVIDAHACRPLPATMDDVTAAGFQIAYGTSHLSLTRRARLAAGETLAVLGAAGGVGLTAVETGKALGARVIAVARGADRLGVARQAGADLLIDGETPDLLAALREAGPVNVVYDPVGGAHGDAALRALAPEGRHILIGFASGALPALKPNHLLVKNVTVIGFFWGGYPGFNPQAVADSMTDLMRWHAEGRIRPHVSHVLPLDRALEGLELLRSRTATGKVVITP